MKNTKIFSFDAETNGLWGQIFAIGAIVYEKNAMTEISRFIGRCPIMGKIDSWVNLNVIPKIAGISITHQSYDELLADFAKFYLANKYNSDMVVHMGYIVEAKLLRDMHEAGLIRDGEGPFPLYDISGNLKQIEENPVSVNSYIKKYKLSVDGFGEETHNPLYDAAAVAIVYKHMTS